MYFDKETPHQFDMFDEQSDEQTPAGPESDETKPTVEKKSGGLVFKGLHRDDESNYPAPDAWSSGKG